MFKDTPVITIDGPSGSGKGTIGIAVASNLGWHYLDSGALYRVLAWYANSKQVSGWDPKTISSLVGNYKLEFIGAKIFVDGYDATTEIRSESNGNLASKIAVFPEVREALLDMQRHYRQPPGLVADGRDMGTCVFTEAPVKVFLEASAEIRAERRYLQLRNQQPDVKLADIIEEVCARDKRDKNRVHAPLIAAADAFIIDTTNMSIDEVVDEVLRYAKSKLDKSNYI